VEFTLRYQGRLYITGAESGIREQKQRLRQHFHEQLREVWRGHNAFSKINLDALRSPVASSDDTFDLPRPLTPTDGQALSAFLFRHEVSGIKFFPLITYPMETHCYLSIRMGRPTRPGSILFGRRDLDNRVKILIDALRMPHRSNELPDNVIGDSEMYCLLADDNLVTRLSIASYRLLSGYTNDADVDVDIDVEIKPITAMLGMLDLLF